jgi:hypothetical protein
VLGTLSFSVQKPLFNQFPKNLIGYSFGKRDKSISSRIKSNQSPSEFPSQRYVTP